MRLRWTVLPCVLVLLAVPFVTMRAQEVRGAPGQFDFYVLNMSWAPEFCRNVQVLPRNAHTTRQHASAADECTAPTGFVLHGLWPQNNNGSYPANCSRAAGPADYTPYLPVTPSLTLLEHEWAKHGTCSLLGPDAFFKTADDAFRAVKIPEPLQGVSQTLTLRPNDLLGRFYAANPGYPQGSILLSCGRNALTAVEVCLSKAGLTPVACQGLRGCKANQITVAPVRGQ